MEWQDHGIILSSRALGENNAVAEILTRDHGRSLGLVRGGRSRRQRPVLQPGNLVQIVWRARLEDHLGTYTLDPLRLILGHLIDDPLRLAALTSLTRLAQTLPEREPHQRLYEALHLVLQAIEQGGDWPALMVRWELGLLEELGFGLDLSECAATGSNEELVYVSPRSGRAVSRSAGEPYHDRLLVLPSFLNGSGSRIETLSEQDVSDGFRLTGHFLMRHVFEPRGQTMPHARLWLIKELGRT